MVKKFYTVLVAYGKNEKTVMGCRAVAANDLHGYMNTWTEKIRQVYGWKKQIVFYITNAREYEITDNSCLGNFLAFDKNDKSYSAHYIKAMRLKEENQKIIVEEII